MADPVTAPTPEEAATPRPSLTELSAMQSLEKLRRYMRPEAQAEIDLVLALAREGMDYRRLLVDADDVALRRGEPYGLCDSIDNDGDPYPSAWAANLIAKARAALTPPPAAGAETGGTDG